MLFHPGLTSTDFGKNALRTDDGSAGRPQAGNGPRPVPDSTEDVARKILAAAITEPIEMGMGD